MTARYEVVLDRPPEDVFALFLCGDIAKVIEPGRIAQVPEGPLGVGSTQTLVYPVKISVLSVKMRMSWTITEMDEVERRWVMKVTHSAPFRVSGLITCYVRGIGNGTVIVINADLPELELVPGWLRSRLDMEMFASRIECAMS